MATQFDLFKFVGAASAPVALVIANGIYLGNLSGKYTALMDQLRGLTGEFRGQPDNGDRSDGVRQQIEQYQRRVSALVWAISCLHLSAVAFVGVVFLTGISMILPGQVFISATIVTMFCGLGLFAVAMLFGLAENWQARHALHAEVTKGMPEQLREMVGA